MLWASSTRKCLTADFSTERMLEDLGILRRALGGLFVSSVRFGGNVTLVVDECV